MIFVIKFCLFIGIHAYYHKRVYKVRIQEILQSDVEWLTNLFILFFCRPYYRDLLTDYGAVWMQNFPVVGVDDLVLFLSSLGSHLKPMNYVGATGARKHVTDMVRH